MENKLDIKTLRSMQKGLEKRAGDGDGILLFASKLSEEVHARLLPPLPNMNGIYFLEQVGWWISGKFVLIDEDNDIVAAEVANARARKDASLDALIAKKNNGMAVLKKEVRYSVPMLTLDTVYDDDDRLKKCEVEEYRVLIAKPTLMRAINSIVTGRPYQNGTEFGLMDRVAGYNIILSKTGKGTDTKYDAMGWVKSMEMPEKWYDETKVPNVMKMAEESRKSDTYIRSLIRNYLYGEAIIEDAESKDTVAKVIAGDIHIRPTKTEPATVVGEPNIENRSILTETVSKNPVAEVKEEAPVTDAVVEDIPAEDVVQGGLFGEPSAKEVVKPTEEVKTPLPPEKKEGQRSLLDDAAANMEDEMDE